MSSAGCERDSEILIHFLTMASVAAELAAEGSANSGEKRATGSRSASPHSLQEPSSSLPSAPTEVLSGHATELVQRVGALASAEIKYTNDEIALLARLNSVATAKYSELGDNVSSLKDVSSSLARKHAMLMQNIGEIDSIDESLQELEKVVAALDEYSRKLEKIAREV